MIIVTTPLRKSGEARQRSRPEFCELRRPRSYRCGAVSELTFETASQDFYVASTLSQSEVLRQRNRSHARNHSRVRVVHGPVCRLPVHHGSDGNWARRRVAPPSEDRAGEPGRTDVLWPVSCRTGAQQSPTPRQCYSPDLLSPRHTTVVSRWVALPHPRPSPEDQGATAAAGFPVRRTDSPRNRSSDA